MKTETRQEERTASAIDLVIRLGALGMLGAWCFILLRPFVTVIVWGAILAIALRPIYLWLERLLGGRGTVASILLTLGGLAIILGPVSLLLTSFVVSAEALASKLGGGTLQIPPPPASVAEWPWVGGNLFSLWSEASLNFQGLIGRLGPQLKGLVGPVLAFLAGAGFTLLEFIAAMVIAGVFLPRTEVINAGIKRFLVRLTPKRGAAFVDLAAMTVRNVARGVVGIAVLQSLLLGIGFLAAGIPFAGLWAFLCLLLAIIQIGPGIVVIGTLIYAWAELGTVTALLFTVWTVPMTLMDNVLRPILMARGLPVPMVVILIGVLGGTLVHGIVGLFVGPVVLALGYELLRAWVRIGEGKAPVAPAEAAKKP